MHKKLYFYFQETKYFGHTPQQKYIMIENRDDYTKLVLNDLDCMAFNNGGNFYAVVTISTFNPPTDQINNIDDFVDLSGVCLICNCFNRNVKQYYRSVDFIDEKEHEQLMALITTVIS